MEKAYKCEHCGMVIYFVYEIEDFRTKKMLKVCKLCILDIRNRNLGLEEGAKENKRAAISEKDKEMIFSKFNNECAICGIKEGLNIHHKDHNPSNNRMNNLIVLCGVCHKKNTYESKIIIISVFIKENEKRKVLQNEKTNIFFCFIIVDIERSSFYA